GIGRPSTFATIVETIIKRGYVVQREKSLLPTDEAFKLIDFLSENYEWVIDFEYTKRMEELLDKVERGELNWKEVVRELLQDIIS
ncbi:MAG: DNA topoisomerase, partial [Aquificaceae bacterium]|nr:DNA topoisomerase [Aquificaceae bacterium]